MNAIDQSDDRGEIEVKEPSAAVCYGGYGSGSAVIEDEEAWEKNYWEDEDDADGDESGDFTLLRYETDNEYRKMIDEGCAAVREGRDCPAPQFFRAVDAYLTDLYQGMLDSWERAKAGEKSYTPEEVYESTQRIIIEAAKKQGYTDEEIQELRLAAAGGPPKYRRNPPF